MTVPETANDSSLVLLAASVPSAETVSRIVWVDTVAVVLVAAAVESRVINQTPPPAATTRTTGTASQARLRPRNEIRTSTPPDVTRPRRAGQVGLWCGGLWPTWGVPVRHLWVSRIG